MTKNDKTYKELSAELEEVLGALQQNDGDIDEALVLFTRGKKLVAELETRLEKAENTLQQLTGTEK